MKTTTFFEHVDSMKNIKFRLWTRMTPGQTLDWQNLMNRQYSKLCGNCYKQRPDPDTMIMNGKPTCADCASKFEVLRSQ